MKYGHFVPFVGTLTQGDVKLFLNCIIFCYLILICNVLSQRFNVLQIYFVNMIHVFV